jgi:hypothetical protein
MTPTEQSLMTPTEQPLMTPTEQPLMTPTEGMTFMVYAPIYYREQFQLEAVHVGAITSAIQTMGLVTPFCAVWVEQRLLTSGMGLRRVRQWATGLAVRSLSLSLSLTPPPPSSNQRIAP